MENNYSLVLQLKNQVLDDSLRHELIFYATLLGSYKSRIDNRDDFILQRQMTSKFLESKYIANEFKNILGDLPQKTPKEILNKFKQQKTTIIGTGYINDGIYDYLKRLEEKQKQKSTGKRLETRLLSNSKDIKKNASDRDIKKRLIDEQFTMIGALVYENWNN